MKRAKRNQEGETEGVTGSGGSCNDIQRLPEGCLAHIFSLTSPCDACRCSAVSTAFQPAADSDNVWGRFLPPDYLSILSRADDPVDFSSKKELFLCLSEEPILLDDGRMSFGLERSRGAKCYTLPARALIIAWYGDAQYWRWISLPDSRFPEVAELLAVCWLGICGRIPSKELSHHTSYAAYLIFKLSNVSYGLNSRSQVASVTMGNHESKHIVSLHPLEHEETQDVMYPSVRDDGWMEVEMGQFYNDKGDDGNVEICLKEITEQHWKKGLILEGIEIRPKM